MLKSTQKLLLPALLICMLSACGEKEKAPLAIPVAYDGSAFVENTSTETALIGQLAALVKEAKKGRTGELLDYNTLSQLFTAGNPSLQSICTPYYASRLNGPNQWLSEMAKASGNTYTPGTPTGNGGTFGAYLFDENGLEMEQMTEKGLFGAALYHYAITLMQAPMTPATADQLLLIFGAHPDFPNTPTAAKAAHPDRVMANYAARRDNNDGNGLYFQMKNAFIKLQAALKAGPDYDTERDEALATLRITWEKINAATVINYCHTVVTTMSATNPTDQDKANALHAYGECVGFIHGWRSIPSAYKSLTDAEIDNILERLNAPNAGTPTSYLFITDPLNELPKLLQVIQQLKAQYGFSNQETEDFRKNWVTEQGR